MRVLVLVAGVLLAFPVAAGGGMVVINNGLAPPTPSNVIDDETYASDGVYARNVGCPPGWPSGDARDPCPSPGATTGVEVTVGASVGALYAYDTSTITMNEGTVLYSLEAHDSSTITIAGGSVGNVLKAWDESAVRIVGSGFEVDGVPVPYGDLAALTGTLTGTLASGDPINTEFCQGGYDAGYAQATGTIMLTFAPAVPALSSWGYAALVSCLAGFGLLHRRRLR